MSATYTRPFHPVDIERQIAAVFSLGDMIGQLRNEPVYRTANRNALTLIHEADLTVVLTVASQGTECENHLSHEPTIFVVLDGDLAIESVARGVINIPSGSAGALDRDVCHRLIATTDCAYLLVMGRTTKPATSASRHLAMVKRASSQQSERSPSHEPTTEAEPVEIEDLVHRLVGRIDSAPAAKRDEIRTYVTDLLAAEISAERSHAQEVESTHQRAPMSLAGLALFLAVMGLAFFVLLPSVAVVFLLLALLLGTGAVVQGLAARGIRLGERLLQFSPRTLRRGERGEHTGPSSPAHRK